MNPYSPPNAPVGDVTSPPSLPRGVRILRGIAVAGNAVVALTVVVLFMVMPGGRNPLIFGFLVYTLFVALFCAVNILALTSQIAPRLLFWGALLSNSAVLAWFVYLHFTDQSDRRMMVLAYILVSYIVPAVLNLTTIGLLRRSRRRAASDRGD